MDPKEKALRDAVTAMRAKRTDIEERLMMDRESLADGKHNAEFKQLEDQVRAAEKVYGKPLSGEDGRRTATGYRKGGKVAPAKTTRATGFRGYGKARKV